MSVRVCAWAWKQDLRDTAAKLLLVKLADIANDDGLAWPGRTRLAAETGISERTLVRKTQLLVDADLLEVDRRSRENGSRSSNLYRIKCQVGTLDESKVPTVQSKVPNESSKVPSFGTTRTVSSEPSVELLTPSSTSVSTADVQAVYDHWRTARGKSDRRYEKLSDGRRAKIKARLREFPAAELIRAINAVALDPWEDRPRHDDLTVLFRSREQVERFLELADKPARNGRHGVPGYDETKARAEEHLVHAPDEFERKHVRALLAETTAGLAGGVVKDMPA